MPSSDWVSTGSKHHNWGTATEKAQRPPPNTASLLFPIRAKKNNRTPPPPCIRRSNQIFHIKCCSILRLQTLNWAVLVFEKCHEHDIYKVKCILDRHKIARHTTGTTMQQNRMKFYINTTNRCCWHWKHTYKAIKKLVNKGTHAPHTKGWCVFLRWIFYLL